MYMRDVNGKILIFREVEPGLWVWLPVHGFQRVVARWLFRA